jgi:hypothetical protein
MMPGIITFGAGSTSGKPNNKVRYNPKFFLILSAHHKLSREKPTRTV